MFSSFILFHLSRIEAKIYANFIQINIGLSALSETQNNFSKLSGMCPLTIRVYTVSLNT
jgi:hypothetical protein